MHQEQLLLLLSICSYFFLSDEVDAIQNGLAPNPGQPLYTVVLKKLGHYHCSGSIIGKNYVITAAHCVFDDIGDPRGRHRKVLLQVVSGISDYSHYATSKAVRADKIYIPEHYKKRNEGVARIGDIAVIKLAQSLDFTINNIGISKLFLPETAPNSGESAIFTGFGWNRAFSEFDRFTNEIIRSGSSDGLLRSARAKILPLSDCQYFNNERLNGLRHVCVRIEQHDLNKPTGACTNDIGGPLTAYGDTLVGILSTYDSTCDETVRPQIYTNVAAYRQFISNAVADKDDHDIYSWTI